MQHVDADPENHFNRNDFPSVAMYRITRIIRGPQPTGASIASSLSAGTAGLNKKP